MTVIALLSVAPVVEDSMSDEIAKAVDALEEYDVEYETNPMGTVIETDEIDELFAAAQAAHEAVDGDRVSTVLKIDDKRSRETSAAEKVEAVEEHLGRPATNREE
ncbi:MTH1187 family thiamine-binding protein [Natronorubrum sp. JWXQ-INN-674]|uniref:MTH1187 family thiamine-binding protein n=1 Tax=Natronorubrum halalkaliphilum TaxID=2691917 RepID=A0A6B0VNU0_9EURY|nr:MTH1187 family thiamine-binding protein [Natronorubrum halalkaliphilum]MXV62209.1 MTH1187 family thiamine-binding protein [Natronorubrum halalkaliphilum]